MEFIDWRELYAANRAVIEGRNVPADPDVIEGHAVAAGPTTERVTMARPAFQIMRTYSCTSSSADFVQLSNNAISAGSRSSPALACAAA